MRTEAGMVRVGRQAGPWRGCVLFLAVVLLPGAAWGQPVHDDRLDEMLWEEVGGCDGAEMYLEELPKGLHAEEAQECLAAGEVERLLEECEAHLAAGRLSTGRGGNAVDCYGEVLSKDRGNRDALSGLERVMEEYGRRVRQALEGGRLERARGYLKKMAELNAESREVEELEDAIAEAKRRKQEAEEAARRARAEAERKRKEREEEARRKRAQGPGTTLQDCPECPEMVVVPEGSFMMGSTSGSDDERPVHEVTFARPFAVGVYEVTFAEWDACVSDGGCGGYRPDDAGWGRGRRPVIHVSWEDAQAYVRWLSGRTGEAYRLLNESEWEYVARAGTTTRYWWGNEIGRNRANCDECGSRWDNDRTAPVGSFSPNAFGLQDVHGNVWEWVEDCWNDSYNGAPSDGSAWESGECGVRVLRGGSWFIGPWGLRSAYRYGAAAGSRYNGLGFRVARTLTP